MKGVLIRTGEFFFKYRDVIGPLVFLALILATEPRLAFNSARGDLLLDAVGITLVLLAQALRAAVIGYAYIIRGGRNKQVYASTLVKAGFFAHVRNPLYLGNLLCIFGLLIIHNSPWAYAIGLSFSLFLYLTIVMAEENFLAQKFGAEYVQYCQQVPRFIPNLRGLRTTVKGMSFNWRLVLKKDYGTTFTSGMMTLLLLAWESLRNFGYIRSENRLQDLGYLLFLLIIAYLAARYMKKTKMLGT